MHSSSQIDKVKYVCVVLGEKKKYGHKVQQQKGRGGDRVVERETREKAGKTAG